MQMALKRSVCVHVGTALAQYNPNPPWLADQRAREAACLAFAAPGLQAQVAPLDSCRWEPGA